MKRLSRATRDAARQRIVATNHRIENFPEQYQKIAHIVNTLGNDIKFRRGAEHRISAQAYAKRRNLVLGPDEDIDGDQDNDVVLYDFNGNPVIINGYELVPSERPYRGQYQTMFASKQDKINVGGYPGFKKHFFTIDGMPEFMNSLNAKYARIKPPRERPNVQSRYDFYCFHVRGALLATINECFGDRQHMKSTFSVFSIMPITYIASMLGVLWNHEDLQSEVAKIKERMSDENNLLRNNIRFELFKQYIKNNTAIVKPIAESVMDEVIRRTIDMSTGAMLSSLLQPILDGLAGYPTDIEFASLKVIKDYDTLNAFRIQKAQLSEEMKDYLLAMKSKAINIVFGDVETIDRVTDDLSDAYAVRIRNYLDSLLAMDIGDRAQAIANLMRNKLHTRNLMIFMEKVQDERYRTLYDQINTFLHRYGWLD